MDTAPFIPTGPLPAFLKFAADNDAPHPGTPVPPAPDRDIQQKPPAAPALEAAAPPPFSILD